MKYYDEVSFSDLTPKEYINANFPIFSFGAASMYVKHNGIEYTIDHECDGLINITSQTFKDIKSIESLITTYWAKKNIIETDSYDFTDDEDENNTRVSNSSMMRKDFAINSKFDYKTIKKSLKELYIPNFSDISIGGEIFLVNKNSLKKLNIPMNKIDKESIDPNYIEKINLYQVIKRRMIKDV